MKRYIAIFLSFFYLLFSTGLIVNAHFCGDKLSSIRFFHKGKGCCCGKEMQQKKCCKEEVSTLKISDTHQSAENLRISPFQIVFVAPATQNCIPLLINSLTKEESLLFADTSPPPNAIPIFLRNCVFLI